MNQDADKTDSLEEKLLKFYEILDCSEKLHGKRSLEVSLVCHKMAIALKELRRFEEAYKQEVRYFENMGLTSVNGDNYLDQAESLLFLGELVWEMDRFSEAIHYYLCATIASRKLSYFDEWDFKTAILQVIETKSKVMKR